MTAVLAAPDSAAAYTVVPLTSTNVNCVHDVSDMNSGGDVVGLADFSSLPFSPHPTAGDDGFFWHKGSFTPLNVEPGWGSDNLTGCASGYTNANALNDSGLIVGVATDGASFPESILAAEWSGSDGSPVVLGSLCAPDPSNRPTSAAYAVNSAGDIAGESVTQAACDGSFGSGITPTAAVLRRAGATKFSAIAVKGTAVSDGGPLQDGTIYAQAINAGDQVVVIDDNAGTASTLPSAYLWTPSSPGPLPGRLTALPIFPFALSPLGPAPAGSSPANSSPMVLNDAGVVVGAQVEPSGRGFTPAYSQNGGAAVGLTTVDGLPDGTASAINNNGDTVGTSSGTSGESVATVWPGSGGVPGPAGTDLNKMLPKDSGWKLSEGVGINAGGDIVAYGSLNGGAGQYVELEGTEQISVDAVSPPDGSPAGGMEVELRGTGFDVPGTTAHVEFCSPEDPSHCAAGTDVLDSSANTMLVKTPEFVMDRFGDQPVNVIAWLTSRSGDIVAESTDRPAVPQYHYAVAISDVHQTGLNPLDVVPGLLRLPPQGQRNGSINLPPYLAYTGHGFGSSANHVRIIFCPPHQYESPSALQAAVGDSVCTWRGDFNPFNDSLVFGSERKPLADGGSTIPEPIEEPVAWDVLKEGAVVWSYVEVFNDDSDPDLQHLGFSEPYRLKYGASLDSSEPREGPASGGTKVVFHATNFRGFLHGKVLMTEGNESDLNGFFVIYFCDQWPRALDCKDAAPALEVDGPYVITVYTPPWDLGGAKTKTVQVIASLYDGFDRHVYDTAPLAFTYTASK